MRSSLQSACDILCAYLDTLAGEPVHRSWIGFYLDVDLTDLEALQSANNMTDYFSEYSSFVGAKGLPSPADTPYETPGYLRSKRSSRATTAGSTRSRERSATPPPLPPDATEYADKSREGRYSALDPRRFTPTLHASLVSEILSLRRELDSKNNLVENLETSLASAKNDNETLSQELTTNAKEVRNARQQMAQMESGAYEALETMVKERDGAIASLQELKERLEVTQKKTRGQDEDAERTQSIWEREKEQWDNERRQLERRVHVTEMRLRTFVEEMATQQAMHEEMPTPTEDGNDQVTFTDSGIGNDSDTVSVVAPRKRHTRNVSSLSFRNGFRNSIVSRALETPEPFAKPGHSLADELGIDEEDEYDMDDFEHGEEEMEYHDRPKHRLDSRHGSVAGDMDSKAKRILGLSDDMPVSPAMRDFPKDLQDDRPLSPAMRDSFRDDMSTSMSNRTDADSKAKRILGLSDDNLVSPSARDFPKDLLEPVVPSARSPSTPSMINTEPKVQYVDTGYQPSPPSSPPHGHGKHKPQPLLVPHPPRATPTVRVESDEAYVQQIPIRQPVSVAAKASVSPISPPETPVDGATWPDSKKLPSAVHKYASTSTQTDGISPPLAKDESTKRDSLQVPVTIPQIAIHPPTSRPPSPRTYVLPPGTKNAGSQVNIRWPGKDASVQTEEIRIDQRPVKLPAHLLPSHLDKLSEQPASPRPTAPVVAQKKKTSKRDHARRPNISTDLPMLSSFPSPPMRSPTEATSPTHSRDGSVRDLGKMPLKAIPLPKPTLAPAFSMDEVASEKPAGPLNRSFQFGVSNQNRASRQLAEIDDASDDSDYQDSEAGDQAGSMPVLNAAGRFEGPDPSQFTLEDLSRSPQQRPKTAESFDAAPAPSISSSRNNSYRGAASKRPPPSRSSTYLKTHSRGESFGSVASSNFSTQSSLPAHAIPKRSSSRFPPHTYSEGAQSPTPASVATRGNRTMRGSHQRQGSLRKVQSAASIRGRPSKISPQKPRRRRRSPNLTPVQSMAFESPAQTKFPIPELPTPLQQTLAFDWGNRTSSPGQRPDTATSSLPPAEETQLIDAIAGTMVGEWMWKYMRKRKSFGVDAAEAFTARNGEDNNSALSSHGTRHKRWVWLSPYERTIMWDSKQPTSGTALLGKKGRKRKSTMNQTIKINTNSFAVKIQSVIDVADETALPKRPELKSAFHRSILILTPSRALKFTAINAERHALWMNALSFLAESDRVQLPQLPQVPPIPDQYQKSAAAKRQRSPSFGRSNLRDSVNLAKGRQPSLLRSISAQDTSSADVADITHTEPEDQGADFPCIPRLYSNTNRHQRKRSNTTSVSPRLAPPFSGLRSFSSTAIPSTSSSSGRFNPSAFGRHHAPTTTTNSSQSDSRRPSVNGLNSPDQFNFFDAMGSSVGTSGVRMQAFVDPAIKNGVLYVPPPPMPSAPPPSVPGHQSPRKRGRGGSNLSNASLDQRRGGYVFDDDGTDPFRGF